MTPAPHCYLVFWMESGNQIRVDIDPDEFDFDFVTLTDIEFKEWTPPDHWKVQLLDINWKRVEAVTYEIDRDPLVDGGFTVQVDAEAFHEFMRNNSSD